MADKLVKHGTMKGYNAEVKTGVVCTRCRNAMRVYKSQFSGSAKAAGIKYPTSQVIDHLYKNGASQNASDTVKTVNRNDSADNSASSAPETPHDPTLTDRFTSLLSGAARKRPVVSDDETHPYVRPGAVDPDPDPDDDDSEPVPVPAPGDEEWVLTEAALNEVNGNLGFYLSIIGMTAEMVDPYCGAALSENFDEIVAKWTKIIGHYPKAAKFFLDGRGGLWMDWIAGLQALWPVLLAVYKHHLSREVKVEGGKVFTRPAATDDSGYTYSAT